MNKLLLTSTWHGEKHQDTEKIYCLVGFHLGK